MKDRKPNEGHGLPEHANPYERLKYIHNLSSFFKALGDEVSIADIKHMMQELIDITRKYK